MQPSGEITAKLFDFLFYWLLKISEKKGPQSMNSGIT